MKEIDTRAEVCNTRHNSLTHSLTHSLSFFFYFLFDDMQVWTITNKTI